MIDWNERVEEIKKKSAWGKCSAIGCPKPVGTREQFCLKHWNMITRDLRSGLWNGPPEMRSRAMEAARDLIARIESRGQTE